MPANTAVWAAKRSTSSLGDRSRSAKGLDVTGPHPADTMFHAGARASYDAAICMYHDQALVPFKTLAFEEGVNVTLGLPFCAPRPTMARLSALPAPAKRARAAWIQALRLAAATRDQAAGKA